MEIVSKSTQLQQAISLLEKKQESELLDIKNHFNSIFEDMKPTNLLDNMLDSIFNSSSLKTNLWNTGINLFTRFLFKKINLGSTNSFFNKLFRQGIEMVTSKIKK
jgi:hypothetical protein